MEYRLTVIFVVYPRIVVNALIAKSGASQSLSWACLRMQMEVFTPIMKALVVTYLRDTLCINAYIWSYVVSTGWRSFLETLSTILSSARRQGALSSEVKIVSHKYWHRVARLFLDLRECDYSLIKSMLYISYTILSLRPYLARTTSKCEIAWSLLCLYTHFLLMSMFVSSPY